MINLFFSASRTQDDAISRLHTIAIFAGAVSAILANIVLYQTFETIRWMSLLVWGGILLADLFFIRKNISQIEKMPFAYASASNSEESLRIGGGFAYAFLIFAYALATMDTLMWLPVWWP